MLKKYKNIFDSWFGFQINKCLVYFQKWTGSSMIELSKLISNYKELHYSFIYFGTNKLKCEWVSNIGHAPECIWEYFCTQLSRYLLRLSVKTSLIRLCRILIKQSANTIENLWLIKNFKGGSDAVLKCEFLGMLYGKEAKCLNVSKCHAFSTYKIINRSFSSFSK